MHCMQVLTLVTIASGIAFKPWQALALGSVTSGNTPGIVGTRVVKDTRISALPVRVASLTVGTFKVPVTANGLWFQNSVAELISFARVSCLAGTSHDSERELVLNFAPSVVGARLELKTRIQASRFSSLDDTSLLAGTVGINSTLGLRYFGDCNGYKKGVGVIAINSMHVSSLLGVHRIP